MLIDKRKEYSDKAITLFWLIEREERIIEKRENKDKKR